MNGLLKAAEIYRLVYNKVTKRIDKVSNFNGLAVESFDPPEFCGQDGYKLTDLPPEKISPLINSLERTAAVTRPDKSGEDSGVNTEPPAVPPAQMPEEPETVKYWRKHTPMARMAELVYIDDLRSHAEALRREVAKAESVLSIPDSRSRSLAGKIQVVISRLEKEANMERGGKQLAEQRAEHLQAELADCKKQLIFANHAASDLADELAAMQPVVDHLQWILPMAKAYAAVFPVGRNQEMVDDATSALAAYAKRQEGKP